MIMFACTPAASALVQCDQYAAKFSQSSAQVGHSDTHNNRSGLLWDQFDENVWLQCKELLA
jgi:hypothetical protein